MDEVRLIKAMMKSKHIADRLHVNVAPLLRLMSLGLSKVVMVNGGDVHIDAQDDPDLAPFRFKTARSCYGSSICSNEITFSEDYDLQIVIPVYNVENFIAECMDSVLNQNTHYKYIVVVVNDGSTDRSREILRKYEHIDNVRIIDQKNRGLSAARNRALQNIIAPYITFVDSDDILLPGAIDAWMDAATRYDADIVEGSYQRLINGKVMPGLTHKPYVGSLWSETSMTGYACMKVYRAELFRSACFPEGYYFEDTLISMYILPLAKRIVSIPDNVYLYRLNPRSIMSQMMKGEKCNVNSLFVTIQIIEDNAKRGFRHDQQQYDQFLHEIVGTFHAIKRMGRVDFNHHAFSVSCRLLQQYYPNYTTTNSSLKPIEKALRFHNYRSYIVSACML